MWAEAALGSLSDTQLIAKYDASASEEAKARAIGQLERANTSAAQEKLFQIASSDPNINLRRDAVRAFSDKTPLTTTRLIQLYDINTDMVIHRIILERLFDAHDAAAHAKLESIAGSQPEAEIKEMLTHMLADWNR
jgi:hypothetical protein